MRTLIVSAAIICAAAVLFAQSRSFTGEIMDSPCAGMHSHDRMMQGVNAKGARECTQKCVEQLKVKYVLLDKSANTVYQLDDQGKAGGFAGQPVRVKGTYDAASKTIHVEAIEAR